MSRYSFTLTTPQDSCSYEAETWGRLAALILSQVSRITRECVHLESNHSVELAVSMLLAMFHTRFQRYRSADRAGICAAGLERDIASCYLQGMTIQKCVVWLRDNKDFAVSKTTIGRYWRKFRSLGFRPGRY